MDDGVVVQPNEMPGSGSKKRACEEFEEKSELEPKRAKTRDLEWVFRSEGQMKKDVPSALDLNAKASHVASDDAPSCIVDTSKQLSLGKQQVMESGLNFGKSRGFGLDLNSEDVSCSVDHDLIHPYKNFERVKPRDAMSECGSTCGPVEEKDPMRVWKEMKQNGFLSSSHGGIPVPPVPKPRGRKKGNDLVIKRKIEIAKREQVDRFAKVAAPSGLLNELNPGIINHVRNSKQVLSIIENIVRSRTPTTNHDGSKQATGKEHFEQKERENGTSNHLFGSRLGSTCQSDKLTGVCDSGMRDRELFAKNSYPNLECEDDILTLKLSSAVTMASENMSSLSNEESANISTVNSLSVKAANVAAQWLELLHQDMKGRLAALRRSRKRVRTVIQTELPFLMSRELNSNQENNLCVVRSAENGFSDKAIADMHRARWSALFNQMDKSLSEEEQHLENSLNQVREMLVHCENGLLQYHPANGLPQRATLENDYRLPKVETAVEKDLAVRAAAAAIYSTSNFLQSMENLPCF